MLKIFVASLMLVFAQFAHGVAANSDELKTVDYVDLSLYAGTWYQIARKPVIFETGCVCSRQVLSPGSSGKINVLNTCNIFSPTGQVASIKGEAYSVDAKTNAKLKVDFGLPNKGDYWIIGLAKDYSWAVVTDPGNVSLYILSKTPDISAQNYQDALDSAAIQRDISVLERTLQNGCSYP